MQQERVEGCDYIHVHEDIVRKVNEQMPEEDKLYDLADFFKVFADSTRIKMLYVLMCSEMCVCDIAQILNMTQSAISHQLRTLKQMDLVRNRREGKTVFYSLADGHIKTILSQGLDHIEED
ncbi:metalloregulator ArsR/SmtB family transcription factor [Kineothrix sedimenti]|uniref:Metalloregulator ArsR/SmtB family transcription factor n=1 Tax=Kineothrix sedimenti TaxID=3123317 RepID=A0ABZ3F371_9FIRM